MSISSITAATWWPTTDFLTEMKQEHLVATGNFALSGQKISFDIYIYCCPADKIYNSEKWLNLPEKINCIFFEYWSYDLFGTPVERSLLCLSNSICCDATDLAVIIVQSDTVCSINLSSLLTKSSFYPVFKFVCVHGPLTVFI